MQQSNLGVTDDVSIIEAMGLPVKITQGSYTNIKVPQKLMLLSVHDLGAAVEEIILMSECSISQQLLMSLELFRLQMCLELHC